MGNNNSFMRSVAITASVLASKLGIKVAVGGNSASTDGETIFLPESVENEPEYEQKILGYLIHEGGHVRFTNFSLTGKGPLERHLVNAIEDARSEMEMSKVYAGARPLLQDLHEAPVTELTQDVDKIPLAGVVSLYAAFQAHAGYGVTFSADPVKAYGQRLQKELGPKVFHAIEDRLSPSRVQALKSTADVMALAREIVDILREAGRHLDPEDDSGEGDQSPSDEGQSTEGVNAQRGYGDSCDSNESSESSGSANGDATGAGNGTSNDMSQSDAKAKPKTEVKQSASKHPSSSSSSAKGKGSEDSASQPSKGTLRGTWTTLGDKSSTGNPSTKAREVLDASNDAFKEAKKMDISESVSKEINLNARGTHGSILSSPISIEDLRKVPQVTATPTHRLEQAKADSTFARRALQGLIETQTRAKVRTATTGWKLSSTRLAGLSTWNMRVFERRSEKKAVSSAVHILLDLSSSMKKEQEIAIRAALALTQALLSFRHCSPALTVFPYRQKKCAVVLPHGVRQLNRSRQMIDSLEAYGSTPLIHALMSASVALAPQREDRKILLVVTDGYPDDMETTIRLIHRLESSGVIVIGLGIRTNVDQIFHSNHAMISDVKDLQKALFGLAKTLLI